MSFSSSIINEDLSKDAGSEGVDVGVSTRLAAAAATAAADLTSDGEGEELAWLGIMLGFEVDWEGGGVTVENVAAVEMEGCLGGWDCGSGAGSGLLCCPFA